MGYGERGVDLDVVVINLLFEFVFVELILVFVIDYGVYCLGFINVLLLEMYFSFDFAFFGV